jgi:ribonuclease BN (tRNA processing enzyme)
VSRARRPKTSYAPVNLTSVELVIIGCSGSTSGPEAAASSYLVRHDGFALLLDLGPGAFGALWRICDPREVDAIALSHLHPDHCLDLCAFNVAANYSPTAPWRRVPVHGPANTAERMHRACEPNLTGPAGHWNCDFVSWQPTQRIGPFEVSVVRAPHTTEAYSIRLDVAGAALVYSGDTGPSPALVELARGADLLLSEAAFRHRDDLPEGVHLSGRWAAEHAEAAGVGTLVLTHVPPWHDPVAVEAEARPHFSGRLVSAQPGLSLTVGG